MRPAYDQQVLFLTALEEQAAGMEKQRRGGGQSHWHLFEKGLCGELVFPASSPGSGMLLQFLMDRCISSRATCTLP